MIETKIICDRCGKEITNHNYYTKLNFTLRYCEDNENFDADICGECAKSLSWLLEKWINEKDKENNYIKKEEKPYKSNLLDNLEWIDIETNECHCYNCELFDRKNNKCKDITLCKNPKNTYKGFYVN